MKASKAKFSMYNDPNESFQNQTATEEEFDSSLYRNEISLRGSTISNAIPIISRNDIFIGVKFFLRVFDSSPEVVCQVSSFIYPKPEMADFISNSIRKNQVIELKGFFRKSFKALPNGDFKEYHSIGPEAIRILSQLD